MQRRWECFNPALLLCFNNKTPKSSYQQATHFLSKLTFFIYSDEVLLKEKESVFVSGQ